MIASNKLPQPSLEGAKRQLSAVLVGVLAVKLERFSDYKCLFGHLWGSPKKHCINKQLQGFGVNNVPQCAGFW